MKSLTGRQTKDVGDSKSSMGDCLSKHGMTQGPLALSWLLIGSAVTSKTMNPAIDTTKHCTCPGDRQFRYHTDFKARTTLRCVKCGKPEQGDSSITFPAERVPA